MATVWYPRLAKARAFSSIDQVPSLAVVWVCRSALMSSGVEQLGQPVFFREREFPAVLAQFRRDPREVECLVDLRLCLRRDVVGFVFFVGQRVLVERVAHRQRAFAHLDVVLLAAGEVHEGRAVVGGVDDTQVDLDRAGRVVGADGGLGVAVAQDLGDPRQPDKGFHDRPRRLGRGADEHVDIPDGLLPPPQRPGVFDLFDPGEGAQGLDHAQCQGQCAPEVRPPAGPRHERDALGQVLQLLGAHPLELGQ